MWAFLRSVLAVLVGIVVMGIVTLAIEATAIPLLMRLFPSALPDHVMFNHNVWARLFIVAYTMLAVAIGGYVAAWIARRSVVLHAVIAGAVQIALTAYFVLISPHPVPEPPTWKWILMLALMIPAAALGGMLRALHGSSQPVAQPS